MLTSRFPCDTRIAVTKACKRGGNKHSHVTFWSQTNVTTAFGCEILLNADNIYSAFGTSLGFFEVLPDTSMT